MLFETLSNERLAAILSGEVRRCEAHGIDWRTLVLARHVLQVPRAQQPTPDGLSAAYIELAHDLGIKQRSNEAWRNEASALLCLVDELIQQQLATAILNERHLMAAAG